MPDELKNVLLARELGLTDDEYERVRRRFVRDKVDAIGAKQGFTRDINLPSDPQEIENAEFSRKYDKKLRDSQAKKAKEREDYNREFYARAGAGLPPVPARKQDINLPNERRKR